MSIRFDCNWRSAPTVKSNGTLKEREAYSIWPTVATLESSVLDAIHPSYADEEASPLVVRQDEDMILPLGTRQLPHSVVMSSYFCVTQLLNTLCV